MRNPFTRDPHPDLTAAIRSVCESHPHEKLVGMGVDALRELEREYAAKAAQGDANAERELEDIRGILKGKGMKEQKTLTAGEMRAVKRANAADLKEYPGKRGEAAHKRLHKVLKSVTEAEMTKGRKAILDAEIVKNIKKGSGRTEADAHRMRRVALSGLRMSGGGRIGNVEAQAAARKAERAARAMGESVLDESPLSRLSDAQLDAKAGHHRLMGYRAEVKHQGSGVEWVPNKRSRGWSDVGKKGRGKFARVREPDPKLKLRAQRHHKAYDLAVAERERRREAEKKKSGK